MTTRRDLLTGAMAVVAAPLLPIPDGSGADPLLALERRYQDIEVVYGHACLAHDRADFAGHPSAPELEASLRAVQQRLNDTLIEIVETPAATLAGLAVKLRFSRRDIVDGPTNYAEEMIGSALSDTERLAKGGAA